MTGNDLDWIGAALENPTARGGTGDLTSFALRWIPNLLAEVRRLRELLGVRTCPCGVDFERRRRDQRYCTAACRAREHARRRRVAQGGHNG